MRWPGSGSARLLALRVLTTGAVILLVVLSVDLAELRDVLRDQEASWTLMSFAMSLATIPLLAWRWQLLLRGSGTPVALAPLTRIYLESMFFGLFLPSAVGGDAYRIVRLRERLGGFVRSTASVVADRLIGLWSVCLLGTVGLVAGDETGLWVPFVLVTTMVGLATWLLGTDRGDRLVRPVVARLGSDRLTRIHAVGREQLRLVLGDRGLMGRMLASSLVQQALAIVSVIAACRAVGIDLSVGFYLLAMPTVWVASLVPAIGGIGPREASLAFALIAADVPSDTATAAGVVVLAVTLARGLVGGVSYLMGGRRSLGVVSPAVDRPSTP